MYSLIVLLSQFGTSEFFHVQFYCFLTHIQISQETGKVVWCSHLLKNFPQFVVIHTVQGFLIVNEEELDVSLEFPVLSLQSSGCWQFDLWFLCLF